MFEKVVIALASASLACAAGGPLLAHFAGFPPTLGLALLVLGGLLGLGAMATGATAALERKAYFTAMIGMLGSLPFIALAAGIMEAARYPTLNDVSTDLDEPPRFQRAGELPANAGRDLEFPPENGVPIRRYYPEAVPLRLEAAPDRVYQRALRIAEGAPFEWELTHQDPGQLRFEAVAATRLFRWKDDVVVRIRPDGSGGSIVDMRSKSRVGESDLGANARRIRKYFAALKDPG